MATLPWLGPLPEAAAAGKVSHPGGRRKAARLRPSGAGILCGVPASHCIDPGQRLVLRTFEGVLTDEDLLQDQNAMRNAPEYKPEYRQLIDARGVERAEISTEVIRDLARASPGAPEARRAFVVASDLAYGLARMFEIQRTDAPEEVRVFRDVNEARAWLGLD